MIPLSAINQLSAAYRGAARQEAYLELAQEHFLDWMRTEITRSGVEERASVHRWCAQNTSPRGA